METEASETEFLMGRARPLPTAPEDLIVDLGPLECRAREFLKPRDRAIPESVYLFALARLVKHTETLQRAAELAAESDNHPRDLGYDSSEKS